MASATTMIIDHGAHNAPRHTTVTPLVTHAHFGPSSICLAVELKADFIKHRQRPDRHTNCLAHIVNLHWVQTLTQHTRTLVEVGTKGSRRKEA